MKGFPLSTLIRDRRNLPDAVQGRLAQAGMLDREPFCVTQRGNRLEARPSFELRSTATITGGVHLVGYAATYNRAYDVYGGPSSGMGWTEIMAPGSWDKTLREHADIRLLLNHEGIPMARTRSDVAASTMTVTSDDIGVLVDAPGLDASGSPHVQSVVSAMTRGDLDQMSCAFAVTRQEWSPDWTERRILEVIGYDVAVVTYPANEDTLAVVTFPTNDDPDTPLTDEDDEGDDVVTASARSGLSLSLATAQATALRLRG